MVTRIIVTAALVVLSVVAGTAGYRVVESNIAKEVYRERLADLAGDYQRLESRYNEAVRKTAVTELVVRDGRLTVRVRTAEGVEKAVETPFDPYSEVYVDYVVLDGRLWIRRVFDAWTPPSSGVVISPELADVDWADEGASVGKAVYRGLEEGVWVVTVTGDGSLGLKRREGGEPSVLTPAPRVRDYEQIERELSESLEEITVADVWRRLTGG